jgi:glycerol-3-phosphate acyltransferase PlsY
MSPELAVSYVLSMLVAYLVGGIPTGYIVARSHKNVDILSYGSKKTGATNVLRTLGWRAAAIVFLGDFGKGVVAVVAARLISGGDPVVEALAALMSVLGHTFSPYIRFRGGRGVSTGVGALAVISPPTALIAAGIAIVVMALTRYVSLGSILGACSAPLTLAVLVLLFSQPPAYLVYAFVGALFVVVTHKDNIVRLLRGTERKLGDRLRV